MAFNLRPDEDDGYFIAVIQLPPASSLERTQAVVGSNQILDSYPEVKTISVSADFLLWEVANSPTQVLISLS